MSSPIKVRVKLIGHYAGQTVKLNKFEFFKGQLDLVGPPTDVAMDLQFLERSYQAYPMGHPALDGVATAAATIQENGDGQRDLSQGSEQDKQSEVSGDSQPLGAGTEAGGAATDGGKPADTEGGQTSGVSTGDGQPPELNQRLLKAVNGLDPENDTHWTADGKPAIQAIQGLYGSTGFNRVDVDAVAPAYNRDAARAIIAAAQA